VGRNVRLSNLLISSFFITFGTEKLEWWVYQVVRRFVIMFSCFGTIPVCDGQTDRRTSCDSVVRVVHTRLMVQKRAKNLSIAVSCGNSCDKTNANADVSAV